MSNTLIAAIKLTHVTLATTRYCAHCDRALPAGTVAVEAAKSPGMGVLYCSRACRAKMLAGAR